MPISYDTQALIDDVERRCSVPLSQMTFTPLDLVLFATKKLQSSIVPLVMRAKQEYFVKDVDIVPDSTGIIPIPDDAVGAKLEYVMAFSDQNIIKIPRLDLGVIASNGSNNSNFGFVGNNNVVGNGGFYVQGNDIHLYPKNLLNTYNQMVKLYYFQRTLTLAEPTAYGRITSIDYNANSVVLNNVPLEWAPGTVLNIQKGTPNDFKILVPSISIVTLSDPTVNLSGSIADVNVGDYVCFKDYVACPQIPEEAHSYLAQLIVIKCMEGLGDTQAMTNAIGSAEQEKNDLVSLISDRVEGQPKKIVNTNAFGGRWSRYGRRY